MSLSDQPVTCWLCQGAMDVSREHVLPEAITYKASLHVSGFICTRCNNTTGSEWDSELAAACRPMFSRDGNYPSRLHESGPQYTSAEFITFGGDAFVGTMDREGHFRPNPKKPEVETLEDGVKRILVDGAADDKRIYEQARKQLEGTSEILSERRDVKQEWGATSQEITIDEGKIRKALVKSYMALGYQSGIDPYICNKAVPFLRGETDSIFELESPGFMFHERSVKYKHIIIIFSAEDHLFGCAHISGFILNPFRGKVLDNEPHLEGLMTTLLSTQYDGPPLMKAYVVHLKDGKHEVKDVGCQWRRISGTVQWIAEVEK